MASGTVILGGGFKHFGKIQYLAALPLDDIQPDAEVLFNGMGQPLAQIGPHLGGKDGGDQYQSAVLGLKGQNRGVGTQNLLHNVVAAIV